MQKPNIKNCSKKVQDYINYLEFEISQKEKEIISISKSQTKSNVYQYTEFLSSNKVYLDETMNVYFNLNNNEINVKIIDNKLHISSCNSSISILPVASNCFDVK